MTDEELAEKREAVKRRMAACQKNIPENNNDDPSETTDSTSNLRIENDFEVKKCESKDIGSDECFIAFARVFSGTVKKDAKLYVLGPKYDPAHRSEEDVNGQPESIER